MGEATVIDRYQAYFCEENIWHLAQRLGGLVLVISNEHQNVAVWEQKLSEEQAQVPDSGPETNQESANPVLWDYHVILAANLQSEAEGPYNWKHLSETARIYDFDTRLSFPTPIQDYFAQSFRPLDPSVPEQFRPQFRSLDSRHYIESFDSDRAHMKNENGEWAALPPDWPPIRCLNDQRRSLAELRDFKNEKPEEILILKDLLKAISASA